MTEQMERQTVLVVGGTGKTGRRVVERLRARGRRVRVGSRSGVPPFEWGEPASWGPVVEGVGAVYIAYSPDAGFPGADEQVGALAKAAVAAGAQQVVLLTGRGEEGAVCTEEAVRGCGAALTVVRASFFAQNFSEDFLVESVRAGEVAFPAGEVGEPFVDAGDIADVAVAALTGPGHGGRVYEVTGPRLVTFAGALAEISAAIGRGVAYRAVSAGGFAEGLVGAGVAREEAELLSGLLGGVLDGRNARVAHGVREALGREARDFGDYVREAAGSGVWDA
ncbi:NmrA family transcriptional regulator [Nocardiopsis mangrovi]|uniref:NmrA family transcriptional regulator n=1 Tax=Nocardiopsis mangrovi TaxID=1179818 RepID=A0ABV9DV40_9ACTN